MSEVDVFVAKVHPELPPDSCGLEAFTLQPCDDCTRLAPKPNPLPVFGASECRSPLPPVNEIERGRNAETSSLPIPRCVSHHKSMGTVDYSRILAPSRPVKRLLG